MKLGLVISSNAPETAWNAFRFGNFAFVKGGAVPVFLLGKGVECEEPDTECFTAGAAMRELVARGGRVLTF